MSVSAIALFGSRARGDHEPGSDTDLLLITSETAPRHLTRGNLSLSLYPYEDLIGRAQRGDLFLCHIVKEAKVLYDHDGHFEIVRSSFRLCKSYYPEVRQASDLGWFLARFGHALDDPALVTRRIAWCVRTILIARSAESGNPVFSIEALTAFAGLQSVRRLIRQKGESRVTAQTISDLKEFLIRRGMEDPVSHAASTEPYRLRFRETSNDVAIQTLRSIDGNALTGRYT
jgi:predicted nucleotidyltransferase